MNICLITDTYSPYFDGGAGIYVETIAREIVRAGHHVTIITTSEFDGLKSLSLQEEKVSPRYSILRFYPLNLYHKTHYAKHGLFVKPFWYAIDIWNLHVFLLFHNLVRKNKWDIIHTHNLGSFSFSILSAIKKIGIPWVHTIHDYAFLCPRSTLYRSSNNICLNSPLPCKVFRLIKKLFWLSPDTVLSPSQFALDLFGKYKFFKNSKKHVLPLGVSIDSSKLESIRKYRQQHAFKRNVLKLLFIGRIDEFKGVRWLLKTLRENPVSKVELHIAGVGPQEAILKRKYQNKNTIFHGYVQGVGKDALMKESDILILPSMWYDNSPVVIYEAFSYGMPVVGSNIGGIPELIRNGQTGFTFEPGNDDQLISTLNKLIYDKKMLVKMSDRCLDFIARLDIMSHVEKLISHYQNCISSREHT